MKKLLVLLATTFCLLMVAAPAFAQARDPFDPDNQTQGSQTEQAPEEQPAPAEPRPQQQQEAQRLAVTGPADVSPWLVAAYGFFALGTGAVLVARLLKPTA